MYVHNVNSSILLKLEIQLTALNQILERLLKIIFQPALFRINLFIISQCKQIILKRKRHTGGINTKNF